MVVMVGRGDPQEMWDLTWCRGFVFPSHVFTFVVVKGAYKREEKSAWNCWLLKGACTDVGVVVQIVLECGPDGNNMSQTLR